MLVGDALELLQLTARLVCPDRAGMLFLLELFRVLAAETSDLNPCLLHPLVDLLDQILAALLGQGRDVEPDGRAVVVRDETDIALENRLLDRTKDATVPGLDHDLVSLGNADAGQPVESRRRAVVLNDEALHE